MCVAHEIKVVFSEKEYLSNILDALIPQSITGYSLSEQDTAFMWEGRLTRTKNYAAAVIVPTQNLREVVQKLTAEISKKWKTPLIQVFPCMVNADFDRYLNSS